MTVSYDEEKAKTVAKEHLTRFLSNLVEEGAEVTDHQVRVQIDTDTCVSKGTVTVIRSCVKKTPVTVRESSPDLSEGQP